MAAFIKRRIAVFWIVVAAFISASAAWIGRLLFGQDDAASPRKGLTMENQRRVSTVITSRPTMEGAGVRLNRIFGFGETERFDPFLLMDHFGSDRPEDYLAGFPWHPHRGMETITYVLEGEVAHMDSLGNKGTIRAGDVQWMTAGSGIIHQEMPNGNADERMSGFQLWANLPRVQKMTAPKYRDITDAAVPRVVLDNGVIVRVIAGTFNDRKGPMDDIVIQPEYLDVTLPPGRVFDHPTSADHTAFAYVFEGAVGFGPDAETTEVSRGRLALFSNGAALRARADEAGGRFVLISGKPLKEPVAWRGPIVMNTEDELRTAFEEYRNGTFIKQHAAES